MYKFNGTRLCTYPSMKCFKQAASSTTTLSVKPPFCPAAFDVKNLDVCDYNAGSHPPNVDWRR